MVLNKPESSDAIAKNALVIPRGGYAFLKIALRDGENGPLTTLDPNWASVAGGIVTITDPDGNPLTWNTNSLDPTDPDDDYNASRASYVGDQVIPELSGLHATLSGGLPVRLALKFQAPTSAEETSSITSRLYTVTWNLKKNDDIVVATETFNIGPPGVPSYSDAITTEQVLCGYTTVLTTDQVDCLTVEASRNIDVYAQRAGCYPIPTPTPTSIIQATIYEARYLMLEAEITVGRAVNSVSQGGMSISFEASQSRLERLKKKVEEFMQAYLYTTCGQYEWKRPRVAVFRDQVNDARGAGVLGLRNPWWWWRDY